MEIGVGGGRDQNNSHQIILQLFIVLPLDSFRLGEKYNVSYDFPSDK